MRLSKLSMLFICIALSGAINIYGQASGPLAIAYVRDEPINSDSPHAIGRRKATFRITNRSGKAVTIFGEIDKDGFDPTTDFAGFDDDARKFLFSNDEEIPAGFDELEPEEKMRMVLRPGRSIEFNRWPEANCLLNRSKFAIYYQESRKRQPQVAISDEIVLDISSLNCGPKQ